MDGATWWLVVRASHCCMQGDISGAESWFIKARILDPTDSSVHQHYGQFLGEVGRHLEAADSYLQAAMLTPGDFELAFNTANALR